MSGVSLAGKPEIIPIEQRTQVNPLFYQDLCSDVDTSLKNTEWYDKARFITLIVVPILSLAGLAAMYYLSPYYMTAYTLLVTPFVIGNVERSSEIHGMRCEESQHVKQLRRIIELEHTVANEFQNWDTLDRTFLRPVMRIDQNRSRELRDEYAQILPQNTHSGLQRAIAQYQYAEEKARTAEESLSPLRKKRALLRDELIENKMPAQYRERFQTQLNELTRKIHTLEENTLLISKIQQAFILAVLTRPTMQQTTEEVGDVLSLSFEERAVEDSIMGQGDSTFFIRKEDRTHFSKTYIANAPIVELAKTFFKANEHFIGR